MTKYSRVTAKIFGETASTSNTPKEIGQFGSAKAGTYNATGDVATIQNLSAWANGWIDAVTPTQQFPSLPEMTGVHKVLSYQEAYLLQQGIPEWDSGTTYYTNCFCSKAGKIYISQSDNNINNDPASDAVNWAEFQSGGSSRSIGEIVPSTVPLSDAGLHLLDGTKLPSGTYSDFVTFMANAYNSTKTYNSDAFTVVGSPTITDGVASGFSGSNYFTITNPLIGATKYSIKVKFTLPSTILGYGYVFADTNASTGLAIYYDSNNVMVRCASQSTVNSIGSPTANSVWEVEVIYNNGTATANYTKDGVSGTKTLNTTGYTDFEATDLFIGQRGGSDQATAYFKGTIDLKEFQIAVNGDIIFSGSKANGFCLEDDWQTSVTNYGVCGKYVYSPFDNTVRLPKITGFIEGGTVSTLGDLTEAGLPNITGHFGGVEGSSPEHDGAFYIYSGGHPGGANGSDDAWVGFDASLSNSIYDNSNTVQPQSVKVLYYVVVGTTTKTSVEVDIDEIATDLNGKADVDLSNVNDTGTSKVAGWAMPSTTYDTLTLGASGSTYIAPANGWFYIAKASTGSNQYIDMIKSSCTISNSINGGTIRLICPVLKNETITINYNAAGSTEAFRFIYAKGSESEA